jgi:hypothetical protein
MRIGDWFSNAIVPPSGVLFSFAFGLFAGPVMSPHAEFIWIAGSILIAFFVWFNAAKTQQRGREDRQRGQEDRERLDKIIQLLEKPGTTLEDVKSVISGAARMSSISSMRAEVVVTRSDEDRPK